jgi:ribose transport system substrate-binding protein
MKKLLLLLLVIAMTVSVFAPAGFSAPKQTVVFSIPGSFAPFYLAAWNGFKDDALKYGYYPVLASCDNQVERQISQIENYITKKVAAIGIISVDTDALGPVVAKAKKAGIPVFAVDRKISGPVTTTIATDNFAAGKQLGDLFVKQLNGKPAKLLIILGLVSNSPTMERRNGFVAAIEKAGNIKIVGEPTTEFDNEKAMANTKNYLQSNPDINCIFSISDVLVPGIMTAVKETGHYKKIGEPGHIAIYSIDGNGEVLNMTKEGYVDAQFSQYPYEIGQYTASAIKATLSGKKVPETKSFTGDIVTPKNIATFKSLWGYTNYDE